MIQTLCCWSTDRLLLKKAVPAQFVESRAELTFREPPVSAISTVWSAEESITSPGPA